MPALLRPGFGETLPALLRDRFGISPRTTLVALAVVAALAGVAGLVVVVRSRDAQYVHRGDPVFNLLYDDARLHRTEAQAGEIVRLEGGRRRLQLAVSVRPLSVPPYRGNTGKGLLPLVAERRVTALRSHFGDMALLEEGRSTVNKSPGYQLAYRTGAKGKRTYWREIFVVPDEESPRLGAVLSFENARPKRVGAAGKELIKAAKSAFRSFTFGTDRR
jgi:hypothetical protein